jgi:chromosome segregation ATPase
VGAGKAAPQSRLAALRDRRYTPAVAQERREPTTLAEAASALEAELARYEALASGLGREPLTTEKQLRRAGRVLQDLQASEARLAEQLQVLVGAIATARERQQVHAERVRTRADEIHARGTRLGDLLDGMRRIGERAGEVTATVQTLLARRVESGSSSELAAGLGDLQAQLAAVAEEAGHLATAAADSEFADLGRQAESLRLQLLTAHNRLESVARAMREGGG